MPRFYTKSNELEEMWKFGMLRKNAEYVGENNDNKFQRVKKLK